MLGGVEPALRFPKDGKCEAPGCQNFGSTTLSQDGSSGWFCIDHIREQGRKGKIIVEKGGFWDALFTALGTSNVERKEVKHEG